MGSTPGKSPQFGKARVWSLRRIVITVAVFVVIVGAIPLAIAVKGRSSTQTMATSSTVPGSTLLHPVGTWPKNVTPTTNAAETTTLPAGKYSSTSMCGTVRTKAQTVEQMLGSISTGGVSPAQFGAALLDLANTARNQASTSSGELQTVLSNLADTASKFRTDVMTDNSSAVSADTTNLRNAYSAFLNACKS